MKNLLRKYYHSELRPDEFSEVSDFIGNKKNESLIFSLMKPFWDKQMNEKDVSPQKNPALYKRIKEAVLLEKQQAVQRKINIYTWGLRVAVVLVGALLVSNIFFFQKSVGNQFTETVQTITTPYGAKTNINLPDGSLVWLNSGSTLSYPTIFSKSRPVTLVGEAFFEVKKDNKPFYLFHRLWLCGSEGYFI